MPKDCSISLDGGGVNSGGGVKQAGGRVKLGRGSRVEVFMLLLCCFNTITTAAIKKYRINITEGGRKVSVQPVLRPHTDQLHIKTLKKQI